MTHLKLSQNFKTTHNKEDLLDPEIQKWIDKSLPDNYNFEIAKTLSRLRNENVKHVALQFPEGLLNFSTQISQILQRFTQGLQVTIMGDVTYGACCIDDFAAKAIGCDFIVHYGHSCLVPIDVTLVRCMYVFVDILFEPKHLCETIKLNFEPSTKFAIMGTIQYVKPLHLCVEILNSEKYFQYPPHVPQSLPLTSGEVLGCTSPILNNSYPNSTEKTCCDKSKMQDNFNYHSETKDKKLQYSPDSPYIQSQEIFNLIPNGNPLRNLKSANDNSNYSKSSSIDAVVFVADGRFHLESAMIQNPSIQFYRYDPFTKKFFKEYYDHDLMHSNRKKAIDAARNSKKIGIIMGTLGRQGNVKIVEAIQNLLTQSGIQYFTMLQCEILPYKLKNIMDADSFIQVACPRLSIDWGHFFHKPLLSPYEAFVAFGTQNFNPIYPMDFYSKRGGAWTNYYEGNRRPSQNSSGINSMDRKALLRQRIAQKKNNTIYKHSAHIIYENEKATPN